MGALNPRIPQLLLCCLLASVCATPALAQDTPQQGAGSGGGRGFGMGGGGMAGMLGPNGGGAEGTVTAVTANEISVKNEQGEIYKVETSPNTHFRKNRDEAKISDVHVGDVVVAAGNLDDQAKTVGAVFVMVLDPDQAARMAKMRADFGKTWTTGKVTAIKDLTVTVERPDKQSQTVTVDENTTFHKRGEDIIFPDIKVGDMVRATGAVQNGSFLATNLMVMTPGGRGPGRFGQGGPQGQSGQGQSSPGAATSVTSPPQPEGTSSTATPAQPPTNPQN
jgi:hypothetical protein